MGKLEEGGAIEWRDGGEEGFGVTEGLVETMRWVA